MSLALAVCLVAGALARAEEPALPEGLDAPAPPAARTSAEPSLPEGLDLPAKPAPKASAEPALPAGLDDAPAAKPPAAEEQPALDLPFDLTGFWELRGGLRTQRDPHEKDATLGETRLQTQLDKTLGGMSLRLTTDFIYDMLADDHRVFLEEGRGVVDLREAWAFFRPAPFMDVKIGRQVLTWGTGDMLFLNDLFPKDFVAFFIGRDVEYLKAPSDAVKVSLFSDAANLDVVYTPRFDADRFLSGRRLSYFNPFLDRRAGRDAVIDPDTPDSCFRDDETALRLYRNVRGYELAAYGYHGFWKDPVGFDPASGKSTFPPLAVYGASARGPAGPGIANMEAAYYDSLADRPGDDPFIPNGQVRFLAGYEQELARDLTGGVQYYVERMTDYDAYRRTLPRGQPRADENRHVVTVRVTRLLMNQNLELSLFTYYSPSDSDAHLRPRVSYKIDDHWTVEAGANVFFGVEHHTFFGQLEDNSNVYFGARCSF